MSGAVFGGTGRYSRGFLPVCLAWVCACLLGALPYFFSGILPRFIDALFESVSGFTTTGATLIADVESVPGPLLFWRGLTQWLGGAGIILLGAAILPLPGGTGFLLAGGETTESESGSLSPKISSIVKNLSLIYTGLTLLLALLFLIGGMGWFDAVFHAFSVIASGGFSSRNKGIATWNSPFIEWVCVVFMFLAGFNFKLLWRLLRGKYREVLRNSEAKAYGLVILVSAGFCAFVLYGAGGMAWGRSIRQALFQCVSMISGTGLAVTDQTLWPPAAQALLFLAMFPGGCSCSTAGGIKLIRHVILFKQMGGEMKKLLNPRGVFSIRLNGRAGRKDMVYGVAGFVFLYLALVFASFLLLCASGLDIFSSLNLALLTQGNIGRGMGQSDFGPLIYGLPPAIKGGLCFTMIAGRLELWAVFALFSRNFRRL